MKYLSIFLFVWMSGLSIASIENTLTADELNRVRAFLAEAPHDEAVSGPRAFDRLRKQALELQWAPETVFAMIDPYDYYGSWLGNPILNMHLMVCKNEPINCRGCLRTAVRIEGAFQHLVVEKWKLLTSQQFTADMDNTNLDPLQNPHREISDRLNSLTRAHADATNDYDWNLDQHLSFIKALGEVPVSDLDELVKTYQTIAQSSKGSVEGHVAIVKLLADIYPYELGKVRAEYQLLSPRIGCRFSEFLLDELLDSYPYVSLEDWEARLDSITERHDHLKYDLCDIKEIVRALADEPTDLSPVVKVVSRYFCNFFPGGIAPLIKTFTRIDDQHLPTMARAVRLLYNPFTSMLHLMGIIDAYEVVPVEKIDQITKAIVIIKTRKFLSKRGYKGTYKDLIGALLELSEDYLMPVAKKVAYLTQDRSLMRIPKSSLLRSSRSYHWTKSPTDFNSGSVGMGY